MYGRAHARVLARSRDKEEPRHTHTPACPPARPPNRQRAPAPTRAYIYKIYIKYKYIIY